MIAYFFLFLFFTNSLTTYAADFTLAELEPRINKYLKQGLSHEQALNKAISREKKSRWRASKLRKLKYESDPFLLNLAKLKLEDYENKKIIDAYAFCIKPFRNSIDRTRWFSPHICEPMDGFNKLRHNAKSCIAKAHAPVEYEHVSLAYNLLLREGKKVSRQERLTDFEKIKMSKCISEQSKHFFSMYKKPIKALRRSCQVYKQSPEEEFFAKDGVCGNFSAVSYDILNNLGFAGRVFIARRNLHMFLEINIAGVWYHTHPFNSTDNSCDAIKF